MKVQLILPALTEAKSPFFRPIKYSLGLATLAGYLSADDQVEIQDEHVELLTLSVRLPCLPPCRSLPAQGGACRPRGLARHVTP